MVGSSSASSLMGIGEMGTGFMLVVSRKVTVDVSVVTLSVACVTLSVACVTFSAVVPVVTEVGVVVVV